MNIVKIIVMVFMILIYSLPSFAQNSRNNIGINLDNADIKQYIKYISEITGKKFILDNNVKGSVTLYMPRSVTIPEAYKMFNSVLLTNGYTTVDLGSVLKIIPTARVRSETLSVVSDDQSSKTKNRYITRIVKLKNIDPSEIIPILNPLIPSESIIIAHNQSKSLIITDTEKNISKINQIIAILDIPKPPEDKKTIGIIKLLNTKSSDLATILKDLIRNENIGIIADQESNSILISSSMGEFDRIKNVINDLDQPRKMVYLESLILEVDTSENFSIGTKWLGIGEKNETIGLTGWSGSSRPSDINTNEISSIGNGFTLGVLSKGIDIGGILFPNITAVLNTYKSNDNIKIISTPQILTKNNKSASLSVGQNIPYLTRSDESNSGNGYSNYEYKDVATRLTILPTINSDQRLSLEIDLEVSKINTSTSQQDKPTTYKRTIKTTVVVKDQETIVLGGIIGNDQSESEWKIPLLGDIPYLGWIFKESVTTTQQTNMFVFITPHIINNIDSIAQITTLKKTLAKQPHIEKVILEESTIELEEDEYL